MPINHAERGKEPAIISPEDWRKANPTSAKSDPSRRAVVRFEASFPLSGLIVCPHCGFNFVGKTQRIGRSGERWLRRDLQLTLKQQSQNLCGSGLVQIILSYFFSLISYTCVPNEIRIPPAAGHANACPIATLGLLSSITFNLRNSLILANWLFCIVFN